MTGFKPEKLVPFIRITRKLRACAPEQQLNIMKQLPQMFDSHQLTPVLTEMIFAGICNPKFYGMMSAALFNEIESMLPSDEPLDLKDSIYESRLMEMPKNTDDATSKQIEKLPLSLLRIPSDLQMHLFHFLDYKDLINVQKVCRALCIGARNPSSLYSLDLVRVPENHVFLNECYSRPKSLTIELCTAMRNVRALPCFTSNSKWGQHVINLRIKPNERGYGGRCREDFCNFGTFVNLAKCEIERLPNLLKASHIPSYYTLRDLTLKGIHLDEDIIDEIRKFKNLQKLSIHDRYLEDVHSDPITLPNLREFSLKTANPSAQYIQEILVGSHPQTVNVDATWMEQNCTFPTTDAMVNAIRAIKYLNVIECRMNFTNSLCPLLKKAQMGTDPFLEKCAVKLDPPDHKAMDSQDILAPLITFSKCTKKLTLKIKYQPRDLTKSISEIDDFVRELCNVPHGTFMELAVDMDFLIWSCGDEDHILFLRNVVESMENEECWHSDRVTVRNAVMRGIDRAELRMRSWLILNEEKMKQIGLRKVDIKCKCDLQVGSLHWNFIRDISREKAKRFVTVLDKMADEWFQQRVERWSYIDQRCIITFDEKRKAYAVTLSFQV